MPYPKLMAYIDIAKAQKVEGHLSLHFLFGVIPTQINTGSLLQHIKHHLHLTQGRKLLTNGNHLVCITLGKGKFRLAQIKLHLHMIGITLLIFLAIRHDSIAVLSQERLSFDMETIKLENFFFAHNFLFYIL